MAEKNKTSKPILISPQAKDDIYHIIAYLSENWGQKVVDEFIESLDTFYLIISVNPRIFGHYNKRKNIRKYVLTKQNVIFYRNTKETIQIITVFDTRQKLRKLKDLLK